MIRKLVLSTTVAAGVAVAVALPAFAEGGTWPGPDGSRGYGRDHHRGGWWMLLLVAALAVGVALLVSWLIARGRGQAAAGAPLPPVPPMPPMASPTASAETILAERLARSEISPEEYHRLLGVLRGAPPATVGAVAADTPPAEPTAEAPVTP